MVSQASLSPFFWAQKVLATLQKAGALAQGFPIRIDDVAEAARELSGVSRIQFRIADFDSKVIAGAFARFEVPGTSGSDTVVEILLSERLDTSWRRFVASKEICQLFFSDTAGYTKSAEEDEVIAYLDGLLKQELFGAFSPAIQTDHLATICAVEVLCPFSEREKVFDQVVHKTITYKSLAQRFGIPESVVSAVFDRTYHENARLSLTADSNADFRLNPRSQNPTSDLEYMFKRNVREALRENERLQLGKKAQ